MVRHYLKNGIVAPASSGNKPTVSHNANITIVGNQRGDFANIMTELLNGLPYLYSNIIL